MYSENILTEENINYLIKVFKTEIDIYEKVKIINEACSKEVLFRSYEFYTNNKLPLAYKMSMLVIYYLTFETKGYFNIKHNTIIKK